MKEKILFHILKTFIRTMALCPFGVLYFISDCLYPIAYYVIRYRRKVVHANITNSFPEKSAKEIKEIEKKFYRHFCDQLMETVKLSRISKEEIRRRLRFTNSEIIEELREDSKPIFLYLGHQCNWEYMISITTWMHPDMTAYQIYHPLSNKTMDRFIYWMRCRFGSKGVPQKQALRTIITLVKEKKQSLFGLISDQRPARNPEPEWMTFLNQETAIITGAEAIGTKIGAHFLYGSMKCTRRGYYELTITPIEPIEGEKFTYSKQYMRMLEKDIIEQPHMWLWSHKRWKWQRRNQTPRPVA